VGLPFDLLKNLPRLIGLTSQNATEWTLILGGLGLLVATIIGCLQLRAALYPLLMAKRTKKQIEHDFGSEAFEEVQILEAIQYYIEPDCSQIDPTAEEDLRQVAVVREKVFQVVDRFLASPRAEKHLLLLADSGMGKTSFLLNYYDRNRRKRPRSRQRIAVIPLGRKDVINKIKRIEQKRDTTLFLDAFDEDIEAIRDHHQRLRELMDECADFRRIVITCRTQFFSSDEEIPREPGVAIVTPRKAGQAREYKFYKLYLLPLTDKQVERYVKRRFGFWQRGQRRAARRIIAAIPELSMRPMLLAVVPDLIREERSITELFQLYEFMVESWLEREKSWIDKNRLREFSELLAVDLYLNRQKRGFERIPRRELIELKEMNASDLDDWRLTNRSLLNRDADGNYKFAHRSILEYLFVVAFLKGGKECLSLEWTDLMKQLFVSWSWTSSEELSPAILGMIREADFRKTKVLPFEVPRREPMKLTKEAALGETSRVFAGTTYIQLTSTWREVFVKVYKSGGKLVVCDFAWDLVWLLVDPGNFWETSRVGFSDRERMLKSIAEENFLGRCDWHSPTLDEFETLFASNVARQEGERLLSATEYYWTADEMVGGNAIIVSIGPEPFEDVRLRYLGARMIRGRPDRKVSYHVCEIIEPQGRLAIPKQFTAQMPSISLGAAEELWYELIANRYTALGNISRSTPAGSEDHSIPQTGRKRHNIKKPGS
jgi:hypothetical protein